MDLGLSESKRVTYGLEYSGRIVDRRIMSGFRCRGNSVYLKSLDGPHVH